jgi:AP-1 complex subunit mu
MSSGMGCSAIYFLD